MKHQFKTPVMQDTPMDLNPDPMVIPTLATLDWLDHTTFAEAWRSHINYVLGGNDPVYPLNSNIIY